MLLNYKQEAVFGIFCVSACKTVMNRDDCLLSGATQINNNTKKLQQSIEKSSAAGLYLHLPKKNRNRVFRKDQG